MSPAGWTKTTAVIGRPVKSISRTCRRGSATLAMPNTQSLVMPTGATPARMRGAASLASRVPRDSSTPVVLVDVADAAQLGRRDDHPYATNVGRELWHGQLTRRRTGRHGDRRGHDRRPTALSPRSRGRLGRRVVP